MANNGFVCDNYRTISDSIKFVPLRDWCTIMITGSTTALVLTLPLRSG